MKKYIILVLLISFYSVSVFADHNRVPINHDQSSHKFGNESNKQRNQKFCSYNSKIYALEFLEETVVSGNYIANYYTTTLSEFTLDSCYFSKLYNPGTTMDKEYPFSSANQAVLFGYADYIWFFSRGESQIGIYRWDIEAKHMEKTSQDFPNGDVGYYYSSACVMDTTVYIFKHKKNSLVADIYDFEEASQQLVYLRSVSFESNNNTYKAVSSAESFIDDDGVMKIAFTTIDVDSDVGEAWVYNPITGQSTKFFSKSNLNNTKIAFGSIQGDKETSAFDSGSTTANNPNRLSVFFVKSDSEKHKGENYNKRCPIGFVQFVYSNEVFQRLTEDECRVNFSSDDYYAKNSDDARIDITYDYISVDKSLAIDGNESHQKRILLINCDKKQMSNFSYFNSDIYMLNPHSSIPVTNFIDTSIEGLNVKDYWTLVGITDGAPPAPIDWEIWDSTHATTIEPTELELEVGGDKLIEVELNNENSYSSGISSDLEFKIHIIPKVELTGGFSTKNSKTNESLNELSEKQSYTISQTMGLNEELQNTAVYFYMVPKIKRYHYQVYPWWDNNGNLPVSGTDDYMFKTTSYTYQPEKVPLNSGIHQVYEPNDPQMEEWKYRGNANNPNTIADYANRFGVQGRGIYWESFVGEASVFISEENIVSSKQEYSYSHEFEYTAGLKIPEILNFTYTNSHEYNFKISNSIESTLDHSIKISYTSGNNTNGFLCNDLSVDTYLFTPNTSHDWWYYDSLPNNFKPWYIAYGVSTVSKSSIDLVYPQLGQQFIEGDDIPFNWKGMFEHFTLYISSSPDIRPESRVIMMDAEKSSQLTSGDLQPGKYYWAVKAMDADGVVVWSESRPFEVKPEAFFKSVNSPMESFPMLVYPNPSDQRFTHVSYELNEEGPVEILLYNLQGQLLWEENIDHQLKGIYKQEIPLEGLLGIGFINIKTVSGENTQKIIRR